MFNPDDLIYPMTFVEINTDKFENEEGGVKKGDVVFVAGTKILPVSEDDPYTQRVFVYVQPVVDDYIDMEHFYLMDPIHISNLSKEENERLLTLAQERADATIN